MENYLTELKKLECCLNSVIIAQQAVCNQLKDAVVETKQYILDNHDCGVQDGCGTCQQLSEIK